MVRSEKKTALGKAGFDEKSFYLDLFRSRTLCIAVDGRDYEQPGGSRALGTVVRDLLRNGTQVIVLVGWRSGAQAAADPALQVRRRLGSFLSSGLAARGLPREEQRDWMSCACADLREAANSDTSEALPLAPVLVALRKTACFVGIVEGSRLLDLASRLAVRLKVAKLVITEVAGGISVPHGPRFSFMDGSILEAMLRVGQAEWAGMASRRKTLEAAHTALLGGVGSVNLCTLAGLADELFTYRGSGTLVTKEDYCRVERLGVDDFPAVERIIAHGQRVGYLKRRTPEEIVEILINGYGATIGGQHLVGVCALLVEPYAEQGAGEIVGLSTLTRFQGEGVGAKLVQRAIRDAEVRGLRYVFACTTEASALAFFESQGFRPVRPQDVPPTKWAAYDAKRLAKVKVYRKDLGAIRS